MRITSKNLSKQKIKIRGKRNSGLLFHLLWLSSFYCRAGFLPLFHRVVIKFSVMVLGWVGLKRGDQKRFFRKNNGARTVPYHQKLPETTSSIIMERVENNSNPSKESAPESKKGPKINKKRKRGLNYIMPGIPPIPGGPPPGVPGFPPGEPSPPLDSL